MTRGVRMDHRTRRNRPSRPDVWNPSPVFEPLEPRLLLSGAVTPIAWEDAPAKDAYVDQWVAKFSDDFLTDVRHLERYQAGVMDMSTFVKLYAEGGFDVDCSVEMLDDKPGYGIVTASFDQADVLREWSQDFLQRPSNWPFDRTSEPALEAFSPYFTDYEFILPPEPEPVPKMPPADWLDGSKSDVDLGRWNITFTESYGAQNYGKDLSEIGLLKQLESRGVNVESAWWKSRGGSRSNFSVVLTLAPSDADALADLLAASDDVVRARPTIWGTYFSVVPSDEHFSDQWGFNEGGDNDIDAPEAWENTTGSPEYLIGVVDSGVDWDHPDLNANIWTNPGEIPGNSTDDDGNGYVDDVRGWDFLDTDNDPGDTIVGHGTQVAGVIAAELNDVGTGDGVVGVAPNAKIIPLRVGAAGGPDPDATVAAINYLVDLKTDHEQDIRAINISLGFWPSWAAFATAIDEAEDAGILIIAAAGNYPGGLDIDTYPVYPASYTNDNVITVAASDDADDLSSFSNYGDVSVDLVAPGEGIYTTEMGGGTAEDIDGTSFAAPAVAGAVALVASAWPTTTRTRPTSATRTRAMERRGLMR